MELVDYKKRHVWLYGDVDADMVQVVSSSLHEFRGKSVHFHLNSEGGDEDSGLAICDLIRLHTGRVIMTVEGTAQSMAAVILQSADVRRITRNSFLMIHQGSLGVDDAHKKSVKAYIRICDWQDELCDKLVLARIRKKFPKYTWEEFREKTSYDVYFSADQSLKWGLVDVVL